MSISHWGMFFGLFVLESYPGVPGAGYAVWRPCHPEDCVGIW
jgi:hypothetical protein